MAGARHPVRLTRVRRTTRERAPAPDPAVLGFRCGMAAGAARHGARKPAARCSERPAGARRRRGWAVRCHRDDHPRGRAGRASPTASETSGVSTSVSRERVLRVPGVDRWGRPRSEAAPRRRLVDAAPGGLPPIGPTAPPMTIMPTPTLTPTPTPTPPPSESPSTATEHADSHAGSDDATADADGPPPSPTPRARPNRRTPRPRAARPSSRPRSTPQVHPRRRPVIHPRPGPANPAATPRGIR